MVYTIKQICSGLAVPRTRVDKWISDGDFRPADVPVLGKAREWTFNEAVRLALMVKLVDTGIAPKVAGAMVYMPLIDSDIESRSLVWWKQWGGGDVWSEVMSDAGFALKNAEEDIDEIHRYPLRKVAADLKACLGSE